MEIKNFPVNDPELEAIASKIRPLPATIVPSEQFVAQMRLLILQLRAPAIQRAA